MHEGATSANNPACSECNRGRESPAVDLRTASGITSPPGVRAPTVVQRSAPSSRVDERLDRLPGREQVLWKAEDELPGGGIPVQSVTG